MRRCIKSINRCALVVATILSASHLFAAPLVTSQRGVVATDHRLASEAGVEILNQGGNAVDAACAAAFAVGVVNPSGSGIGGGGFMVIKLPEQKHPVVIDFRETAPSRATSSMFLNPKLPKEASRRGALAVATPGEVLGCATAIQRFGKLSLKKALAPAIRLARRGFPVEEHLSNSLAQLAEQPKISKGLITAFFKAKKPLVKGERLVRPALANTLSALARHGAAAFYQGWIARDIVNTTTKHSGILSLDDLARYRIKERDVLKTAYRGYEIYTMPPPSSGGVALVEALNILEQISLKPLGHNSAAYLHWIVEALKHAFADRARFLGDTDFVEVPVEKLTSRPYAESLRRRIGEKTLSSQEYGDIGSRAHDSPRDHGTSHISVIDKEGGAVALTTTINTSFGSQLVAPRSGIILNNEMDDFSTQPGEPNAFGLIQSAHNVIAPQKRPLSSMTPTIVTKDGRVVLVVGASGGPTIITGTLQVLLNVVEFGFDAQAAVAAPRVHHQWLPDRLLVEPGISVEVQHALRKKGHVIQEMKQSFTAVQLALFDSQHLIRSAASDARKHGHAVAQ